MSRRPGILAALTALVLFSGSVGAVAEPRRKPGPEVPVRTASLTLVTGDEVRLDVFRDGRQAARLTGGDAYRSYVHDREAHVVPVAAEPYLDAGLLDPRLFNISRLLAESYDRRAELPLVLSYPDQAAARAAEPPAGSTRKAVLASAQAQAVRADRGRLREFWAALTEPGTRLAGGVAKVWLDGRVKASLEASVPQVGAPAAWQAGFDGTGGVVAVLDTGIDDTHPDLAGKVLEHKNFSEALGTEDKDGHGTHVASTVAGTGAASGGAKKGVAPGAKLLNGKVLDDEGFGTESGIIAGMEWAAGKAKVVSMSIGGGPTDGTDPMAQAVNRISRETGALFVIAAGNSMMPETVTSPGSADAALTVAAVDKQDKLAPFTSRGPRFGDHAVKPDLSAPGVAISAAAANSAGGERYQTMNGTSMATPHVSGAAALLAQRYPAWTGPQLKAALMSGTKQLHGISLYDQGAGRLDAGAAVTGTPAVRADAGSLSLGRFLGPYGSLEPVTRKVTYTNDGTAPVTVDLAATARTTTGASPAGQLSVSPAELVVPAGGSAEATVTLDLNLGEVGLYQGALTATPRGGGTAVRTALGFHKDLQHKLSVRALARDGKAPGYAGIGLWNLDTGTYHRLPVDASGGGGALVPPGSYFAGAFLATADPLDNDTEYTVVTKDELVVDGATTLTLDARGAREVRARTAEETEPVALSQTWTRASGARRFTSGFFYGRTVDRLYAMPMAKVARGEFELANRFWLETPAIRARVVSPDTVLNPDYMGLSTDIGKRLDGEHRLPVVYVGGGTPEEFAGRDIRGKIALIRQSETLKPDDQVKNAVAAKAGVAVVFGAKPGRFADHTTRNPAIPALELSNAEGRRLLDLLSRGPVSLDLKGSTHSPVQYHLVHPLPGGIPAGDLSFDASPGTLAAEQTRLHRVLDRIGSMGMFSYRPYDFIGLTGSHDRRWGTEHTRYFSANGTTYSPYFLANGAEDAVVTGRDEDLVPGSRRTTSWYQGPFQPGLSTALVPVTRLDERLRLNFAEFLDSDPDHYLRDLGTETAARVYRNGELVAEQPHALGEVPVGPAGDGDVYRVELDVHKGRPEWTVADGSFSAWTFRNRRAEPGKAVPLPVFQARWSLDLGLDNAAPADAVFGLALRAATQPGAPAVRAASVRAEVSYNDGGTWQRVDLRVQGADGGYAGAVQHPRKADSSGFVSLRVHAEDVDGNSVEQTLIRAYALR
ncbi:subtilisin family serine protease [Crossiella equi]|uniref:Subtilisin family serine protease n=2 Tax=Crossiella equi TaxID=130796 RepID=A0ABS5ACS8_9PSEU|nr:S8 family serine peptidase [Crossiella equi]MBP2474390.1 subtilisin family serine protease [Crossiella equi]